MSHNPDDDTEYDNSGQVLEEELHKLFGRPTEE